MDRLGWFRGRWDVRGPGWSGEMRVTQPMAGWQTTELCVRHDDGMARKVSMRDGYNPFNDHFVRRKEADSGSWFDYESPGWTGPGADTLVWEGSGHNFYGREHGRVRSVYEKVDEDTFRVTDYIHEADSWQQTYALSYTRQPAEDTTP